MNKITKLLVLAFVLLTGAVFAQQNILSTITLTNAVAVGDNLWTVSSTSALSAPGIGTVGTSLWVENELVTVNSILSSTQVYVNRTGSEGSLQQSHVAGALIFYGYAWELYSRDPKGYCNTNTIVAYPWINTVNGLVWGCYGSSGDGVKNGIWEVMYDYSRGQLNQFASYLARQRYSNIAYGGTAWASVGTTLSPTTTTTYVTSVYVPLGKLYTGISYLSGTTFSGTPHATVAIWGPNGGTPLAYSATTASGATTTSIFYDVPFTTAVYLPPGRYFVGLQMDATTSHCVTVNTGYQPPDMLTTSITGGTYGTISTVSLTAPTTYTTAVGPVVALY